MHYTHLEAQASGRHNGGQTNTNQLPQHDRLGPRAAHTSTKHGTQHWHWSHQVGKARPKEAHCQDGVEEGGEAVDTREGVGNLTQPGLGLDRTGGTAAAALTASAATAVGQSCNRHQQGHSSKVSDCQVGKLKS